MNRTGWVTDSSPKYWQLGDVADVKWRPPRELAIDIKYEAGLFSGILRSNDGVRFTGKLKERHSASIVEVDANAYENKEELLFFGRWTEEGTDYLWWLVLDKHELD